MNNLDKDNKIVTQFNRINLYLKENTASRYMASIDTGVPIQNVCWYVEKLFNNNQIAVIRKDKCDITGELVEYLSTNSELFIKDTQLTLWD